MHQVGQAKYLNPLIERIKRQLKAYAKVMPRKYHCANDLTAFYCITICQSWLRTVGRNRRRDSPGSDPDLETCTQDSLQPVSSARLIALQAALLY